MKEELIAKGKTKRIFSIPGDDKLCRIESMDDITAGDGTKHDVIKGKAALANRTTCNVFRLLKAGGIPVAFEKQISSTEFTAPLCDMLPYEVVVRREAHGSYLKRAPYLKKGHFFPKLIVEFYLKTSGRKWKSHDLICDDPLMDINHEAGEIYLYDPKQPNLPQAPSSSFLTLPQDEVFTQTCEDVLLEKMAKIARWTFLILEKAWQLQGRKLVDFKVEFGIDKQGDLLLADVIDNDSWRVLDDEGQYMDKQVYRDGGNTWTVLAKYQQVADLTDRFSIPVQQILLWRGSDKDDLEPFNNELSYVLGKESNCRILPVTCSAHKQPALAYHLLQQHVSKFPDTVIIAYIGMSNGAGPILAANATVPVITVPAGYKEFPDDVWSSLRVPSNVPVMTMLSPANAVLAALQILAMRNPVIYARLRIEQEKRLTN